MSVQPFKWLNMCKIHSLQVIYDKLSKYGQIRNIVVRNEIKIRELKGGTEMELTTIRN